MSSIRLFACAFLTIIAGVSVHIVTGKAFTYIVLISILLVFIIIGDAITGAINRLRETIKEIPPRGK
jgi:Zn-dependent protease with chaperone function